MVDYSQYKQSGVTARYSRIPIQHLDDFRARARFMGNFFKIRYRGPRRTAVSDNRGRLTQQSTCLKQFATHFSVYNY